MSWIRFSLTLVLVVVATVSAALLQGRMLNRWGMSERVRKAAARLQEFPTDLGDWHMTAASELDEDSQSQLESVGEIVRNYKNVKTGERVTLLFILGPTGPTAAHTPEVCIAQSDYTPLGDRRELAVGNDRFWNKRFKAKNVHGESLSVYWAWTSDGNWIAPKDARYTFAGLPCLYKAQVTCGLRSPADSANDAGQRFLTDFVPVAVKYTVPRLDPGLPGEISHESHIKD